MKLLKKPWIRWTKLLAACVLVFLMLRWFEHSQVYHPDRVFATTGSELGRSFEDVWFESRDGLKLNGWFFPADTNSPRRQLAVLFCHGNGGNIGDRLGLCRALLSLGVNVFLFDYRGYGRSAGRPGEEGTYLDAQAAYQWLRKKGFAGTNIIAYGESLGGAIACELAVREKVGGLVLQSTFCSMTDIGAEVFPWLPVRLIGSIKYNTCAKLNRLKVPLLVMHSRTDGLVGFHHAERNFAAANEPKMFWELEGTHNETVLDQEHFLDGLEKFLKPLTTSDGQRSSGEFASP